MSNELSTNQTAMLTVESTSEETQEPSSISQDNNDTSISKSASSSEDTEAGNTPKPSTTSQKREQGESADSPQEVAELVKKIVTELAEENAELVERVVKEIGVARSLHIFEKTLTAEATGGIMTHDGSRRRTPGGVFFFLVRGRISKDQYYRIWERSRPFHRSKKHKSPQGQEKKKPPSKKKVALHWPARIALFKEVAGEHGQATNTEVKLIGRPIKVLPRGKVVILTLRNRDQPPLPRGLPKVEDDPTVFLVFLTLKQWKKIADSMEDTNDKLIVTGFPVFSNKLNAIAVWAQRATTVQLEKARHAARK